MTADPFAGLALGMVAQREYTFTSERVTAFADIVDDHAPAHFDEDFARASGFSGRIVHGFFLSSLFSGLLGERLPGPSSVINQATFKVHRPVVVGDTLHLRVTVTQVTPAVRAVALKLDARAASGEIVLSGFAICSFPHVSKQ